MLRAARRLPRWRPCLTDCVGALSTLTLPTAAVLGEECPHGENYQRPCEETEGAEIADDLICCHLRFGRFRTYSIRSLVSLAREFPEPDRERRLFSLP